jgi:hypothetical protein
VEGFSGDFFWPELLQEETIIIIIIKKEIIDFFIEIFIVFRIAIGFVSKEKKSEK